MHIRIISPSGHIASELIDAAVRRLERWGFTVTEGLHARIGYGRFAGTKEERLSDLAEALGLHAGNVSQPIAAPDVILCSRGGYGLQQIIDCAAELIQSSPHLPLLIGFSDITCLHSLYAFTDTPSLHGLMCHIGDWEEGCPSVQQWLHLLHGGNADYHFPRHPMQREGEAEGVLIGGNLSVLYGLQGTPWSLLRIIQSNKQKGKKNILFLEDVCERHYHIDRMMQNLRLSGVLGMIDGLVTGGFTDIEDDPLMPCSVAETIRQAADGYDYPILTGFPAGHGAVNLPFFLNRQTTLTVSEQGSLFFQQGYDA